MRGLDMPFSTETLEEKPHNICISCPRIGQTCDGPNFLSMSVNRWCEWCRLRRDFLGWKNNTIADKSGISKMSIERIMAGDSKDLRITTMQAVTRALVNGSWGQSPCVLVTETEKEIYVDNPVIVAQCQQLQIKLDDLSEEYKKESAAIREEAQEKIDFLKDQVRIKDRHIELLHAIIERFQKG
jgi:transcriptional regulator with XRE-family HTH domain